MTETDRQRIIDDISYLLAHLTDKQLATRHAQIAAQVARKLWGNNDTDAGVESN